MEMYREIVQQKHLTRAYFRYTVIVRKSQMANVLNTDKQIAVIGALADGSSIHSSERATHIRHDTREAARTFVVQGYDNA